MDFGPVWGARAEEGDEKSATEEKGISAAKPYCKEWTHSTAEAVP
jgi:hypothetical protein